MMKRKPCAITNQKLNEICYSLNEYYSTFSYELVENMQGLDCFSRMFCRQRILSEFYSSNMTGITHQILRKTRCPSKITSKSLTIHVLHLNQLSSRARSECLRVLPMHLEENIYFN